ncbi:MAG: galactokinase [Oscillospiraceae bacterium]|jgi:galactokinase|nr:galactokinase [Oscillospiraceae bacterium]
MLSLDQLTQGLQNGAFLPDLEKLYGDDAPMQAQRLAGVAARFALHFSPDARDVAVFSAPGRSEIGGNHTDHNRGKVLAAGVNLDVLGVAAKTGQPRVRVKSAGYNPNDVDLATLTPVEAETGHSNAMIRGICAGFAQRGRIVGGFEAATASDVLGGSGLSSSAAFGVLIATMMNHFYNGAEIAPIELARIVQYAENEFVGKPCGLMDQTASAVGGFVAIDFADTARPAVTKLDFDFAGSGHALCIVNTGGSHADLTDDYAAVRREMESVAGTLGAQVLRETSKQALLADLPHVRKQCGDRAILRALHYFAENDRVDAQAAALGRGDFAAFLALIRESGQSSFMYNQNVHTGEMRRWQPVSLALALSESVLGGRGAWRVHGGGFAGTIQAFVPLDLLEEYRRALEGVFGAGSCYVLKVRAQGGVRVI